VSMDFDDLLGGDPGPAASPANLEGVMRRHLRRRRRFTGGIAAAVLTVGLGGGALVGEVVATSGPAALSATGPRSTTGGVPAGHVASSAVAVPATSKTPAGLAWSAAQANAAVPTVGGGKAQPTGPSYSTSEFDTLVPFGSSLHKLFDRTAGSIQIRVFEVSAVEVLVPGSTGGGAGSSGASSSSGAATSGTTSGSAVPPTEGSTPAEPEVCGSSSELVIEVSDAGAVGTLEVPMPFAAGRAVDLVAGDVLGQAEGSPIGLVVVRVGSGVSEVAASFTAGGSDESGVVDGIAVLAAPLDVDAPSAAASVDALGPSGQVVESFAVPATPELAEPAICFGTSVPPGGKLPVTSSGSPPASSGSATASTTAP
jgi:hypothetical protein